MANSHTTQRAYTMRLMGRDSTGKSSFQTNNLESLWNTHKKINEAVKIVGSWFLTLRGGLPADLTDCDEEKIGERRRLLALCWFSVESSDDTTEKYRIQTEKNKTLKAVAGEMKDAFYACLKSKGITQADYEQWWGDCKAALTANIREDSVWVQRWKMFDDKTEDMPTSQEAQSIFLNNFGKDFLKSAESNEEGEESSQEPQDPTKQGRGLCSNWFGNGNKTDFEVLSDAYGKLVEFAKSCENNPPNDLISLKNNIIAFRRTNNWTQVCAKKTKGKITIPEPQIANNGPQPKFKKTWETLLFDLRIDEENTEPSSNSDKAVLKSNFWKEFREQVEKQRNKKTQNTAQVKNGSWTNSLKESLEKFMGQYGDQSSGRANTEYFYFVLGQGMARLSQTHSWVKNAEKERQEAEQGKKEAEKFFAARQTVKTLLDTYISNRSESFGSFEGIVISNSAIKGWDDIVKSWQETKGNSEQDELRRKDLARQAQESAEKFGDINLFLRMAENDYLSVWLADNKPDPEILKQFAKLEQSTYNSRRFKVPSYRHPDPISHPVFCQFGSSKPAVNFEVHEKKTASSLVKIFLLDGRKDFNWHSRRLREELGLAHSGNNKAEKVPRVTKVGLKAMGIEPNSPAIAEGVFEAKDWNARLEIYRPDLNRLKAKKNQEQIHKMIGKLRWLITFSPKLSCNGPFQQYIKAEKVKEILKSDNSPVSVNFRTGNVYYPKGKSWMVRPGLGVLPGIRVMGVDIGQRFGAVCSVWQQIQSTEIVTLAQKTGVLAPNPNAVSFRCPNPDAPEKLNKSGNKKPEFVFRKVAENSWARLERQFAIRLPGEYEESRPLQDYEILWLEGFHKAIGCAKPVQKDDVCSAQLETLRLAKLALQRHGDLIKIYQAFHSDKRILPGGREKSINNTSERAEYIQSVMGFWHNLAESEHWSAKMEIKNLWNTYVHIQKPEEMRSKKAKEGLEANYKTNAEALTNNLKAMQEIPGTFLKLWQNDDLNWKGWLKNLSGWIGKGRRLDDFKAKLSAAERKNSGGVSLRRITAIGEVSKLQRAYAQRPNNKCLKPEISEGDRHGKTLRDKMERLREDRLKKLSGAIVLSAMGLVSDNRKDKMSGIEQGMKIGPRFAPVHVIAVENLDNYKTSELRTRRENRGLMSWSAAELKKYLQDACELYGLYLAEVQPSYTSRFCSRCGAPGVRCAEKTGKELLSSPYWQEQLDKAVKKDEAAAKPRDKWLKEIAEMKNNGKLKDSDKIRFPQVGGEIFTCSNQNCEVSGHGQTFGGIQADFNASANIAIRAMMDPSVKAWQYIPTQNGKPAEDKFKGLDVSAVLLKPESEEESSASEQRPDKGKKKGKSKEKTIRNLFRDISGGINGELAESEWNYHEAFFPIVEERVIRNLRLAVENGKKKTS